MGVTSEPRLFLLVLAGNKGHRGPGEWGGGHKMEGTWVPK